MKKFIQKTWRSAAAILLTLVMLCGLMPVSAVAAGGNLKVGGIQLSDGKCLAANGATAATDWQEGDPYVALYKDGVLYLNNYETTQESHCIYFSGYSDLIIDVTGSNILERTGGACINVESYGYGLVVQGTGLLTVIGSSFGFWVREGIEFRGDVTVDAQGGTSIGVASACGNANMSPSEILVKDNSKLTATGGQYGVGGDHNSNPHVIVQDNAQLIAKGGTYAVRTKYFEPASDCKVFAGAEINGSSKEVYASAKNNTYKYVEANPTTYDVTVADGTGSGAYSVNTLVNIHANEAPVGKQFNEWAGADGLTFTSGGKTSADATFLMPANEVCVSATYKDIPYVEYDLWVAGVQVTSYNADNITGEGISGTVSYDADTKTLTLNNASIGAYEFETFWHDSTCIYGKDALTVNLVGNNTLTGADLGCSSYCVYLNDGDLRFTGNGSIVMRAAEVTEHWSVAAFTYDNIIVDAGCSMIATCSNTGWILSAIYCYGNTYDLPQEEGILVAGNRWTADATNLEICQGDASNFKYLRIAPGYGITLNVEGGCIDSGEVTCYFADTGAVLPTDVSRYGYDFGGWYDNAQFLGDPVTQIPAYSTGNKEYWAKWIAWPTPVAQIGDSVYYSLEQAIADAGERCVQLLGDCGGITVTADVTIDLNGWNLTDVTVNEGVVLFLVDSASNYHNAGGSAAVTGAVAELTELNGKKYMVLEDNGVYAAHRYYIGITMVTLAPNVTGFGYQAEFYGDEAVQAQIKTVGYDLWLTENRVVTRTADYKECLTLRLKNFQVEEYGQAPVYAKVFMTLTDGTRVEGATHSYSMMQMVELVNEYYEVLNIAQLQATAVMIKRHPVMEGWNVANILATLNPSVAIESITVTDQSMQTLTGQQISLSLDSAYCFSTNETAVTLAYSAYTDWIADYYITMDQEAGDGLYLAGNYGNYGWIVIPVESGKTYTNVPIVESLLGTSLTYTEMVNYVSSFSCGVADTQNSNTGATITVELRLTNPENPEEYIIVNTISFTFA